MREMSRSQIADRVAGEAVDGLERTLRQYCRDRDSVSDDDISEIVGMLRHDIENTINHQLKMAEADHYDQDIVTDGGQQETEVAHECGYCGGEELVYEFHPDGGTAYRCIRCIAIEPGSVSCEPAREAKTAVRPRPRPPCHRRGGL